VVVIVGDFFHAANKQNNTEKHNVFVNDTLLMHRARSIVTEFNGIIFKKYIYAIRLTLKN
jgi:metallophosphoesterase superfamily enzyme